MKYRLKVLLYTALLAYIASLSLFAQHPKPLCRQLDSNHVLCYHVFQTVLVFKRLSHRLESYPCLRFRWQNEAMNPL